MRTGRPKLFKEEMVKVFVNVPASLLEKLEVEATKNEGNVSLTVRQILGKYFSEPKS